MINASNHRCAVCALPAIALALSTLCAPVNAQSSAPSNVRIPVRQVAPPVTSRETFTFAPAVRGLPGGRVLVQDFRGKRVLVFDSTLATFAVSADSDGTSGVTYPVNFAASRLIPYLGDSSLFVDQTARTFVLIDPAGHFGRAVADPAGRELANVSSPYAGNPATDNKGRIIYRASNNTRPPSKPGDPPITATRDTINIVRADFDTRTVDTIGFFTVPRIAQTIVTTDARGKKSGTRVVNPVQPSADEWAVLADGTLAVVREHDYHIDWVTPDGAKSSSAKLPFDWVRLTDEMKTARIDSMKRVIDSVNTNSPTGYAWMIMSTRSPDGGRSKIDTIIPIISFTPLAEMPDYISPIRQGSVRADADNNLWILPSTSSQVGNGLLYDVVNRKGELSERVRLPAGSVLWGFGKDGVLFLGRNDAAAKTWTLQRTRVVR